MIQKLWGSFEDARSNGRALMQVPVAQSPLTSEMKHEATISDIVQKSAPWGLARISHREKLSFSTFSKYVYNADIAGLGTTVYVIDTGILTTHEEFEGRASWGTTVIDGEVDEDGNGRGTHTAGTIGGRLYGVAKNTKLIAVKAAGANGYVDARDVVKAVNWVTEQHHKSDAASAAYATRSDFKGSALYFDSASLGGAEGDFAKLKSALDAAIAAGVHVVVPAGMDNDDQCTRSLFTVPTDVITVGASTLSDERAYFSNYGSCVDLFAPGLNVQSASTGNNLGTKTLSGTDTAAAHVAGLVAYLAALQPEPISPGELKRNLLSIATNDILAGLPENTPNLLAFNNATTV